MNRGTALKWIDLLESGKYKHGTGALRDSDNCFCVLGVLADFLDNTKWKHSIFDSYLWGSSGLMLDTQTLRSVKIKSLETLEELIALNDLSTDYAPAVQWLKENYERL